MWAGQHPLELLLGLILVLLVIAVNHKYETLCILEVMEPQRPGLVLVAHIPCGKADILILHGLHWETYGGNGGHDLTQPQFVPGTGVPLQRPGPRWECAFLFCKKGPWRGLQRYSPCCRLEGETLSRETLSIPGVLAAPMQVLISLPQDGPKLVLLN